jgi:hypothetical protein
MVRALASVYSPAFDFAAAPVAFRYKVMIAVGFACGVAVGLVHARMIGLL